MFSLEALEASMALVHSYFPPTPTYTWPLLNHRAGCEVWVKHENHTPVGAFKVRGGLVFMDRLRRRLPECPGIISATRGNHGQSLAYAGGKCGIPVTIVVPEGNSIEKNQAMRMLGAVLIEHGSDFDEARAHAQSLAESQGLLFAPSYHPDLVEGVATWALEMFRAAPALDVLYVPIGLGSGISGAIRTRDLLDLDTEIVGVQSSEAPSYALSYAAGHVIETNHANTRADGLATRQPSAEALAVILAGASGIVTVTDDEVASTVRTYWTDTHNLAEGAGAAPLAALLQQRDRWSGKRAGVVLSGGNIDLNLFRDWILA